MLKAQHYVLVPRFRIEAITVEVKVFKYKGVERSAFQLA